MFTYNGFVYGSNLVDGIKVNAVKPLEDKMMIVTFSSGEDRLFDASVLSGPAFEQLNNQEIFMKPSIEHGVIVWDDGNIDCAPEYVYKNSYEYCCVS